ncbi:thioredoxin domain-containing protein [Clostridium pasteurianum DSM 525 = ATCC 6013]|uniref:Thioredoxin domain-containing protein n=1 Tax=Clostridium pasteurianum DSM 525 = ATCC 6013 TaxID=1262449 RepID=A0A0H3JA80_CLOPA|nr:thioredoxin domain-containing protein [Clostridium pasteurianum]AJA49318.1 thioredoxin domain-containing protein [Clostridium pasteurianum DSM 525 = ATCC 6013]AJA53306.1 thioredoxin domain-containing protein [Clostridium pasteurianum DSM 525 = ATCC 6013]AOZ76495.1 thioredoxin [Clostridium pasteurianum DSM 525 = ATCC 6013]AOZ80292.1 thioredoxin [Clostridium pasteurianum]ELP58339.1 thioredoxin domain-containing protein [Clostridium pasteurianum DSM 525 = ATCC 6013]
MNLTNKPNRLINEKSPYLLQHAHNPVDWYPWGEEAFNKADRENKPVFLSVGYSTCHWCHVMNRESFEDEEVAEILNKYFVAIKVDREERPDIDNIYMSVCQAITGSGGWPLTIIMTAEKKPFFAGTYLPKIEKYGQIGIIELLDKVNTMWIQKKDKLLESSNNIVDFLQNDTVDKKGKINEDIIDEAYNSLKNAYDPVFGGFSDSPKFPIPHNLSFLLRYYKIKGDREALQMVENTLDSMYSGGIFDHIGFGFARYSVDSKWLVPHFEKMLYDNALLAIVYTETYQITHKNRYKEIVQKIFDYTLRDMTNEDGGFYSAEDADSEGVEGKFYLWDKSEIENILEEDADLFNSYYNIKSKGNFEGRNIPNLIGEDLEELENEETKNKINRLREKLFNYREKRVHPHKDDKILTAWNGLMIAAMAYAGKVFKIEAYKKAAKKASDFILANLIDNRGRLLCRYRDGETGNVGFLDDYAFFVFGLIELYEATFEVHYLKKAVDLNGEMIKYFWDEENSGFFFYGKDSEELILKTKEIYDGALPSGNSVAAMNLIRLSRITGDVQLEEKVAEIFSLFSEKINKVPLGYINTISAFLTNTVPDIHIVIAGDKDDVNTKTLIDEINKRFLLFASVVFNDESDELSKLIPYIEDNKVVNNKATAYVCKNKACLTPVNDVKEFMDLIEE